MAAPVDNATLACQPPGFDFIQGIENLLLVLHALVDLMANGKLKGEPSRASPFRDEEYYNGRAEWEAYKGQQDTGDGEEHQGQSRFDPRVDRNNTDAFIHLATPAASDKSAKVGHMPNECCKRIEGPNINVLILVKPPSWKFMKDALDRIHRVVVYWGQIGLDVVIEDMFGRPLGR